MIRKTTWILLALFAALLGIAWYLQSTGKTGTASTTPTTEIVHVFRVQASEVNSISITSREGKRVAFEKIMDNTWSIEEQDGEAWDLALVESLLQEFLSLRAVSQLDSPPPLDVIGLDVPAYIIRMNEGEETGMEVKVGNINPTNTGYYLQVDSGPVVVVNRYSVDSILGLLNNPPLLPTPTATSFTMPTLVSTQTLTATWPISGTNTPGAP